MVDFIIADFCDAQSELYEISALIFSIVTPYQIVEKLWRNCVNIEEIIEYVEKHRKTYYFMQNYLSRKDDCEKETRYKIFYGIFPHRADDCGSDDRYHAVFHI